MNLLSVLINFAASEKPREEDPITEVLAWLLRRDGALLDAFRGLVGGAMKARGIQRALPTRQPAVATQVVVSRGAGGTSRYDLVLDDHAEPLRIVVEIKVSSGLTMSSAPKGGAPAAAPIDDGLVRHQLHDYLEIAAAAPAGTAYVLTLAPGRLDIGAAARAHRCYGGHLYWQDVYNAFAACLRSRKEAAAVDPAARLLTEQFLGVMEVRNMAAPRLTFDGITSVQRYMKFRQSLDPILEHVHDTLIAEGAFEGFAQYQQRGKQDDYGRIGYRIWFSKDSGSFFAFEGISHRDETMVEGVPDLIFFLEMPLKSEAAQKFDAHAAEIQAAISTLNAIDPRVEWGYSPESYQRLWAVKSLADVAASSDPREATLEFFRGVARLARERGLIQRYVEASVGLK